MISLSKIKYFERKLLDKNYENLESEIQQLKSDDFNHPAIKVIYANSKILKDNPSTQEKKIAFDIFLEIFKSNPNFINGLYNACVLCLEIKQYDEILNILLKFIKENKYNSKIYQTLFKIYSNLGETERAIFFLRKIISNEPENLDAWSAFLFLYNYQEKGNQQEYLNYCNQYSKNVKIYNLELIKSISQNNKINLGFITPFFIGNAIDGFLTGLLKNINKEDFETSAFNLNKITNKSDHLKNLFDNWHNVSNFSDLELINFIKKKKIDILVDLVGHGPGNRMSIFKNKSAPIQISWLGYCNSTGINEIDYIVVDKNLIKDEEKKLYSENVLYLPNIWNSHDQIDNAPDVNYLPFFKNKFFTFGSFNNFKKINKDVIEVWSEILEETDGKLILKSSMHNDYNLRKNFLSKFPNKIIKNNQIKLLEGQEKKIDHLRLYNELDLALDTFPYNGVTTSFESIWMGVPVLVLKGNNFISRCGESINKNLNLNEFIADNKKEYIEKAINLSKNPEILGDLRIKLRQKALNSPLFDTKSFGRNFGEELKKLFKKIN